MTTNKIKPLKNHQEITREMVAAGKVSEKELEKARTELENDPEWLAFLASQPKRKQA